jgi:hypothetical protein
VYRYIKASHSPHFPPYNQAVNTMQHSMPQVLILGFFSASLASASGINIIADSQVSSQPGSSLIFYLSSDYASYAPAGSPYPGEISVLLGGLPVGGVAASSVVFSGTLESMDGSMQIPLSTGDLSLTTGYRSGGSYTGPISELAATVNITAPEAQALFAPSEFVIQLHDLSGDFAFGYPGSTIGSAFSASLIAPDGSLSVGARPMVVNQVATPEPETIGLMISGLAALLLARARVLARQG